MGAFEPPVALFSTNKKPKVGDMVKGLVPPRLMLVLKSWTSGSVLVLTRLDRLTFNKLKRALIVPPVALRSGPDSVTFAGATSSFGGAVVKVSTIPITLPPDWRSGPALSVELVSWINGRAVVLES